jgi:hypothetical protein
VQLGAARVVREGVRASSCLLWLVFVGLSACGGGAQDVADARPADDAQVGVDAAEPPPDSGTLDAASPPDVQLAVDAEVVPDAGTPTSPDASVDAGAPGDAGACTIAPVQLIHDGAAPSAPVVHFLDGARYPDAVCNDGTPAAFFLRRGTGDAARRWVIYLEGGGSCLTPAGCAARPLELSSTAGITRTDGQTINVALQGVASADPTANPDFYDATFVQLNYCSSDLWSGDLGATAGAPETDLRHWHFRGKRIVRGVFAELLRTHGLGDAREVFLMGSSAGGAGTLGNIDEVAAALPPGVRFVGMVDGAYGVEYPPFDPVTGRESTTLPPTTGPALAQRFAAWSPIGDASCAATYGPMDPTCNVASRLLATQEIATPLLVVDSQLDSNQLADFGVRNATNPDAVAFAQRYAAAKRVSFGALDPRYGLFSLLSTVHVLINKREAWPTAAVDGVTLRDTVGRWYRDPCAPTPRVIDQP